MGKITGFLEYSRRQESSESPSQRKKHWHEFIQHLSDTDAHIQAARCMDCGTPFCQNGCPVDNIIPDFNDLVYRQDWKHAIEVLHSTNNFPEFTGRICPAPCEAACTLTINSDAVGIKSIEHKIIDKAWEEGWVVPQPALPKTGRKVAVVGSGPAGLATAQQLARVGHAVTIFEKHDRIGGLLRYGIPNFKLEKRHIDRRVKQLCSEGVGFRTGVLVGAAAGSGAYARAEVMTPEQLQQDFDAVVMAGGAETPRDLPVPGRELSWVHLAMDFLSQQNQAATGDPLRAPILATGKHVMVIGGGDTGSDCVGTSNRQAATSITQFELLPQPPSQENTWLVWPYWPTKLRTSSSHEEGCERDWAVATKRFNDDGKGHVKSLTGVRLQWHDGKMNEIAGSEFEIRAELVLLAMGFISPEPKLLDAFGVAKDSRGNVKATTDGPACYQTCVEKVFVAGDMRRGQSLVVWAIREGRQCARAVDEYLMGTSILPR